MVTNQMRNIICIGIVFGFVIFAGGSIYMSSVWPTHSQGPAGQFSELGQRYQISAWAYPKNSSTREELEGPLSGAYILDGQTGQVFLVTGRMPPREVGNVKKVTN